MVGTDIIEVARIEKLIKEKGDKFLNRIYTNASIDALSVPFLKSSLLNFAPFKYWMDFMIIDLPEPVSPVTIFNLLESSNSKESIIAILFIIIFLIMT